MKTQIIPEGSHYTNWWQMRPWLAPKSFDVEIYLDKSLWYPKENEDSKDSNKLIGKSFGDHRNNSLRISYVPIFDDREKWVKLFWYTTINKVDENILIGEFLLGSKIKFCISDDISRIVGYDYGIIERSAKSYKHPSTQGLSYYLNAHFGGDNKAPHRIKVKTKISNRRYW